MVRFVRMAPLENWEVFHWASLGPRPESGSTPSKHPNPFGIYAPSDPKFTLSDVKMAIFSGKFAVKNLSTKVSVKDLSSFRRLSKKIPPRSSCSSGSYEGQPSSALNQARMLTKNCMVFPKSTIYFSWSFPWTSRVRMPRPLSFYLSHDTYSLPEELQKETTLTTGSRQVRKGRLMGWSSRSEVNKWFVTWDKAHLYIRHMVDGNQKSRKLTSWGIGSLPHYLQGELYIPGGCFPDFQRWYDFHGRAKVDG